MNKLVNKYETRIKNFVLKMAENSKNKNNNKNQKSYQPLFTFSPYNNTFKNQFNLKNYKPDKERVEEILFHKTILDKYLEKIEKTNIKRELKLKKGSESKLIQPSMRYTGRTDLERIYDVIRKNENYYSLKNTIKNNLKKIELKSHSMEDNDLDEYDMHNENNLYNKTKNININMSSNIYKKIIKEKKNNLNKKIFLLNLLTNKHNENKKFKNTNQKTEFKAMENLKMFKTSTLNHNIFNKIKTIDEEKQKHLKKSQDNQINEEIGNNFQLKLKIKNKKSLNSKINLRKNPMFRKISSFDNLNTDTNLKNNILNNIFGNSFNNIIKNKINNDIICKRNNSYEEERQYNIYENTNELKEFNIIKEVVNANPLLYNLNHFNDKKKDLHMIWNKDHLDELKKIAFEKYEILQKSFYEKEKEQEASKNLYEDIKKEENIFIDGKEFKRTEIDKIAETLLRLYNSNDLYNKN